MAIEKGQLFTDTTDGRELIVTQYAELPNGPYVEFLEINPIGVFVGYPADELDDYGIEPKFPELYGLA